MYGVVRCWLSFRMEGGAGVDDQRFTGIQAETDWAPEMTSF